MRKNSRLCAIAILCGLGVVYRGYCAEISSSGATPSPSGSPVPTIHVKANTIEIPYRFVSQSFFVPFEVENIGKAPLEAKFAKRSCGCVAFESEIAPILPGQMSVVKLGYVPLKGKEKHGEQVFTAELTTNDPATPTVTLSLKTRLINQVEVKPSFLDFGVVADGETPSGEITLERFWDGMFPEILSVAPTSAGFMVRQLDEQRGADIIMTRYQVVLDSKLPSEVLESSIVFTTSSNQSPILETRISARTAGSLSSEPKAILLGIVQAGASKEKSVKLSKGSNPEMVPVSAKCDDPRIMARIAAGPAEGTWTLMATLKSDAKALGPVNTRVDVFDSKNARIGAVALYATVIEPQLPQ